MRFPVVFAILALLAGCGGDNNDGLSYEETGTELSDICRKYDTAAEEEKLSGNLRKDGPLLESINERTQKALDEIRDLDVNEELKEARDEFIAVGEASLERGQSLQRLAEAGDRRGYVAKIKQLQRANRGLNTEADAAAAKLGAPACGQNA